MAVLQALLLVLLAGASSAIPAPVVPVRPCARYFKYEMADALTMKISWDPAGLTDTTPLMKQEHQAGKSSVSAMTTTATAISGAVLDLATGVKYINVITEAGVNIFSPESSKKWHLRAQLPGTNETRDICTTATSPIWTKELAPIFATVSASQIGPTGSPITTDLWAASEVTVTYSLGFSADDLATVAAGQIKVLKPAYKPSTKLNVTLVRNYTANNEPATEYIPMTTTADFFPGTWETGVKKAGGVLSWVGVIPARGWFDYSGSFILKVQPADITPAITADINIQSLVAAMQVSPSSNLAFYIQVYVKTPTTFFNGQVQYRKADSTSWTSLGAPFKITTTSDGWYYPHAQVPADLSAGIYKFRTAFLRKSDGSYYYVNAAADVTVVAATAEKTDIIPTSMEVPTLDKPLITERIANLPLTFSSYPVSQAQAVQNRQLQDLGPFTQTVVKVADYDRTIDVEFIDADENEATRLASIKVTDIKRTKLYVAITANSDVVTNGWLRFYVPKLDLTADQMSNKQWKIKLTVYDGDTSNVNTTVISATNVKFTAGPTRALTVSGLPGGEGLKLTLSRAAALDPALYNYRVDVGFKQPGDTSWTVAATKVLVTKAATGQDEELQFNLPASFFALPEASEAFVFGLFYGTTIAVSSEVTIKRKASKLKITAVNPPTGGWKTGKLFTVSYSFGYEPVPAAATEGTINVVNHATAGAKIRFSLLPDGGSAVYLTQSASGSSLALGYHPTALIPPASNTDIFTSSEAYTIGGTRSIELLVPYDLSTTAVYSVNAELLPSDVYSGTPLDFDSSPLDPQDGFSVASYVIPTISVQLADAGRVLSFVWPTAGLVERPGSVLEYRLGPSGSWTNLISFVSVSSGRAAANVPFQADETNVKFRLRHANSAPSAVMAESEVISFTSQKLSFDSVSFGAVAPVLKGVGAFARGGVVSVQTQVRVRPNSARRQLGAVTQNIEFLPASECDGLAFSVELSGTLLPGASSAVRRLDPGAAVAPAPIVTELTDPAARPVVCEIVNGYQVIQNRTVELKIPTGLPIANLNYSVIIKKRAGLQAAVVMPVNGPAFFFVLDRVFDYRLLVTVGPPALLPPNSAGIPALPFSRRLVAALAPNNDAVVTWRLPDDSPRAGMFAPFFDSTSKGFVFFGTYRDPEGSPIFPVDSNGDAIPGELAVGYDGGLPIVNFSTPVTLFPNAGNNVFEGTITGKIPSFYVGNPTTAYYASVYITEGAGAFSFDPADIGLSFTPAWDGPACRILDYTALPKPCSRSSPVYLQPVYGVPQVFVTKPSNVNKYFVDEEVLVNWVTLPIQDLSVVSVLNMATTVDIWFVLFPGTANELRYQATIPEGLSNTWFLEGDPDLNRDNATIGRSFSLPIPNAIRACGGWNSNCRGRLSDTDLTSSDFKPWVIQIKPKNGGADISGVPPYYTSQPFAIRPRPDVAFTSPAANSFLGLSGKGATYIAFKRFSTFANLAVDVELRDYERPRFSYQVARGATNNFAVAFPFDPMNLVQGTRYYLRVYANDPREPAGRFKGSVEVPVKVGAYDKVFNVRVNGIGPTGVRADSWNPKAGDTVRIEWSSIKADPTNFWVALCTNEWNRIGKVNDGVAASLFRTFGLPSAPSADGMSQKCVKVGTQVPERYWACDFLIFGCSWRTRWFSTQMDWSLNVQVPPSTDAGTDFYFLVGFEPPAYGNAMAEVSNINAVPAHVNTEAQKISVNGKDVWVETTYLARSRVGGVQDAGTDTYFVYVNTPSVPTVAYVGSRMSLGWITQGPKATSSYKIKIVLNRNGVPSATTTLAASNDLGACDSNKVCRGYFTWQVPEELTPAFYTVTYKLVNGAGVEVGKNSAPSAQIEVSNNVPRTISDVSVALPGAKTELTAGEALTIGFYASYSVGLANGDLADVYLATSCAAAPSDVLISGAGGVAIRKYQNTFTWTVPATTVVPAGCGNFYYVKIVSRVINGKPSLSAKSSGTFTLKPSRGAIVYELPQPNAAYSTGQTLSVRFATAGISSSVLVQIYRIETNGAATLLGSGSVNLDSSTGNGAFITASAPRAWLNGADSVTLRVRASTSGAEPVVSVVDGITLSLPNSRLLTGVVADAAGSTGQNGERTFKLGSQVTASWSYTGFPSTARISAYLFTSADWAASGFVVPNAKATAFTNVVIRNAQASFSLPGSLDSAIKYRVAFVMVGYAPNSDAGTVLVTPVFAVQDPPAGVLVSNVEPIVVSTGLKGDAFIQGGRMSISWDSFGAADGANKLYNIYLDNNGVPGFVPILIASGAPSTGSIPNYNISSAIDISSAVANKYFVRIQGTGSVSDYSASSSPITIGAPRVAVRVVSPTLNDRRILAPGLSFTADVIVTNLNDLPDDQRQVTAYLKNLKVPSFAYKGAVNNLTDSFSANFTLSDMFPDTYSLAFASKEFFYVEVRSTVFTSIGGVSARFTIDKSSKMFCFNTKKLQDEAGSSAMAACTPTTMQTGWMALLQSENFTVYYSTSNAIPGETAPLTIKNARSDQSLPLGSLPVFNDGDRLQSVTYAPGTLNALAASIDDVSARSWFYMETTYNNKAVKSPYFTIAPGATLFVTEPTSTRTLARGQAITVKWEGAALAPSDQIQIQFVNPVSGAAIDIKTVAFSDKSYDFNVPTDADISPSSVASSWSIKISAKGKATLFSNSANLKIVSEDPLVRISAPSSTTVVQLGEPLTVSWEALNLRPTTTLGLYLLNSMPDMADFRQVIVENVDWRTDSSYVWMVPKTLTASGAVRSAYYVSIQTTPDSAVETAITVKSPAFTLTNTDLSITISSPAPEDVNIPGGELKVQWGVRKVTGNVTVTLSNAILRQTIVVKANVSAAAGSVTYKIASDFPSAGSSSSQWYVSVVSQDFPAVTARAGPFSIQQVGAPLSVNSPNADTLAAVGSLFDISIGLSADAMTDNRYNTLRVTLLNRLLDTFSYDLTTTLSKTDAAAGKQSFLLPRSVPLGAGIKSQYYVRVQSATVANGPFADSDPFTLSEATATLNLNLPAPGVTLIRGEVLSIGWTSAGLADTAAVTIELLNPALGVKLFLAEAQAADMSLSVAIPKRLALPTTGRDQFTVRVSARGGAVVDESPRFKISPPPARLKVVTPPPNSKPIYINDPIRVVWLASNIPGDAAAALELVAVSSTGATTLTGTVMTVGTGYDLTEAVSALSLRDNANDNDIVTSGAIDFQIPEDAIPSKAPGGIKRRWKLRVKLADDAEVFGESSMFDIAEPRTGGLEPPILSIPAGITSGGLVAGLQELTVTWTHPNGYTVPTNNYGYDLDLMCYLPESPELPTKIVRIADKVTATAGTMARAFVVPGLAVSRYPVLSSCIVQATGNGDPYGASECIAQSSKFSVYKPPIVINLLTPSAALPVTATQPKDEDLPSYQAGALFPVGWRYAMTSGAALPDDLAFDSVKVQLWKRGNVADNGASDVFVTDLPVASASATNTTLASALPLSSPFGIYYVSILATFSGGGVPLSTTSGYFRIKPTGTRLSISSVNASIVAGQSIRIVYELAGVAATNQVKIALRPVNNLESSSGEFVLAASTEATGLFKGIVPYSVVAGSYKVRVSLVQDPTLFDVAKDTTTVTLPSAYVSITNVSPSPWVAGSTVQFDFSVVDSSCSDCNTVNITLMQDRFYLAGGDKAIAVISGAQSVSQTTVKWIVPADLPSWAPVYLKVQATSATKGSAAPKGTSDGVITLKSAPPKALADWTDIICKESNAGSTNLPYLPTTSLPFCKTFCSACTAAGGSWVTGASVAIDFTVANWPGNMASLNAIKSAVGAFASAGASLCLPNSVLAAAKASASDPGVFEMHFKDIPAVNAQLSALTGGKITGNLTVDLALTQAFSIYDNCNAIKPMVAGSLTVTKCADPSDPAKNAEIINEITLQLANKTGVDSSMIKVTLEPCTSSSAQGARRRLAVAAASGTAHSGTMQHHTNSFAVNHAGMARRLLTHDDEHPNSLVFDVDSMTLYHNKEMSSEMRMRRRLEVSNNGGGSFSFNLPDDGGAQNGGDQTSGTGYTGSSLQGNDAGSGLLAALYALYSSGGLGAEGSDFFTSGDFQTLVRLAAAREAGATNEPASTPQGTNTGAIIGGVIGGIAALIILIGLVIWAVRINRRDKMYGSASYAQVQAVNANDVYGPNAVATSGSGALFAYDNVSAQRKRIIDADGNASNAPVASTPRPVVMDAWSQPAAGAQQTGSTTRPALKPHASGLQAYANPKLARGGNNNSTAATKEVGQQQQSSSDEESSATVNVKEGEISPLVSSPSTSKKVKQAFV